MSGTRGRFPSSPPRAVEGAAERLLPEPGAARPPPALAEAATRDRILSEPLTNWHITVLRNLCNPDMLRGVPDEIAQLSRRGTLTLPADIRRTLGLQEGDVLTVRLSGRSIVLTPAVVTPIELYTEERISEFEQSAQLSDDELGRARRAWGARASRER
jgi:AbrB family looped-hinge helix DNA binding protein